MRTFKTKLQRFLGDTRRDDGQSAVIVWTCGSRHLTRSKY